MKYRSEIDGLRALAVVPVILFHAGFELFSGGFVGVDVFFVISGYLITTILIEDIENKRFSIVNFYERRARRILPALFVVMLACIPFAWMWMLPSQIHDFLQSLVSVSLFVSNMFFWRKTDYFSTDTDEWPLIHTWSLAVEEQYYMLFPIFLILAWRFGKDRVFWMIVVMAAISFIISEWGWRYKATANFYFTPTRAWELFAGSIAAFNVQKNGVKKNHMLSSLGLAAIIFSILAYDERTPFPSGYALIPVLGTVLLILYADKDTLAATLLSKKVFVSIGLISYSAYLWHQPLFAFARIRMIEHPSDALMLALSVASIMVGWLSWRFVEKPFRSFKLLSSRALFIACAFVLLTFVAIGSYGHFGFKKLEKNWISAQEIDVQKLYKNLSYAQEIHVRSGKKGSLLELSQCRFNVSLLNDEIEKRITQCNSNYGKGVLILGDSHAIDLFGIVTSRFDHPFIIGVTQGGCRPHTPEAGCQYDGVKKLIKSQSELFSSVIFEQAGFYLLLSEDGSKGDRKIFNQLSHNEPVTNILADTEHIHLVADYLDELATIVPVKWFLPRVEPHIDLRFILAHGCDYPYSLRPNQYKVFRDLDLYIRNYLDTRENSNLNWVSQNETFKFNFSKDFVSCKDVYWNDGDHISASGQKYFGLRLPRNFLDP